MALEELLQSAEQVSALQLSLIVVSTTVAVPVITATARVHRRSPTRRTMMSPSTTMTDEEFAFCKEVCDVLIDYERQLYFQGDISSNRKSADFGFVQKMLIEGNCRDPAHFLDEMQLSIDQQVFGADIRRMNHQLQFCRTLKDAWISGDVAVREALRGVLSARKAPSNDRHEQSPAPSSPKNPSTNAPEGSKESASLPAQRIYLKPLPPPPTKPKYNIDDNVFLIKTHRSLAKFRFRVTNQYYDRENKLWRYKVMNNRVIGEDQYVSVREENIINPHYEVGQQYDVRDNTGDIAKGKVRDVRVVDGKLEYEVDITYKSKTLTGVSAEAMGQEFLPRE